MTKLTEWSLGLGLLAAAWSGLAFDPLGLQLPEPCPQLLWALPAYLAVGLGCLALATVGFRLATFNDCRAAAQELQEQVREARRELAALGFRFPEAAGEAEG